MRKVNLTPGKFSQQSAFKQMDITPDKQYFIDKQRKSIERLSNNPKTTRREIVEWEMKQKKYQEEIAKLNKRKQQLQEKIQRMQNEEKEHTILEYEMYIVELNKRISEQEAEFNEKYRALEERLQLSQIQNENKQVFENCQRYKNSLCDVVIAMTYTFSCFMKLKEQNQTFSNVEKQFVKLYSIVQPYSDEFQIQSSLESMIQEQEQQQRCSVMTFPPNSIFKQTFNTKELFEAEVSTNKSEISFEANFYEGNSYEVKKSYSSVGADEYLNLNKGDEVRLLKRNGNGMWIAESGQSIGFLLQQILF